LGVIKAWLTAEKKGGKQHKARIRLIAKSSYNEAGRKNP
jgi:hypothetical protein